MRSQNMLEGSHKHMVIQIETEEAKVIFPTCLFVASSKIMCCLLSPIYFQRACNNFAVTHLLSQFTTDNQNLWIIVWICGVWRYLGSQGLRARLGCCQISDSIFWLYYFTPRWLAGAMPCPKKFQKKYTKRKDRNR